MKKLQISALIFFILSYLSLILFFAYDNEFQQVEFPYFFIIWIIGILNFTLNIFYGSKLELNFWILISLVISGVIWIYIPLLFTILGIPLLIIYLIIGIYIHTRKKGTILNTIEKPLF